jgi:ABC-type multidrug transport system fused ATPase/permease subunit
MTPKTELSTAYKVWSLLTSKERRTAIVIMFMMFIGMMLETLGVGMMIPALALFTQGDIAHKYPALQPLLQALGNPSQRNLVIGGMLTLVGLFLFKSLFLTLLTRRQMHFSFGVQAQLSQRLFAVYMHQPYTFHLQRNSAQLIFSIINEVSTVNGNGLMPFMTLLTESFVMLGLCTLLVVVEPKGALIAGAVLCAAAWGFHRLTATRILRWGYIRQQHEGLRVQHLQQGLGGAKDVKIFGRENEFIEEYRLHNILTAQVQQNEATMQQIPRLWLELLAVIGLAILVISMLAQDRALEAVLPTVGLFAAAAFRLMPSVNRVLGALHSLHYGLPMLNNVYNEINLSIPEVSLIQKNIADFRVEIELNRVTYTYPGGTESALKEVSLVIKHGESIGFIGTSGAGKSTLVDILLGLLSPDTGEVKVDGNNIQENLRSWQDQIGYVPQTIYLTDDTLRRNVAFGLPSEQIDDASVQRAIQAAQLEDFVSSLPDGLETLVGERGVRLSGGQRQRIGIARALYHDPAVLVLDEATSSLDTDTENGVMQAVTALHGRKTILIVAHRLSTIEGCDRVYRMEDGRLVDNTVTANGAADNAT